MLLEVVKYGNPVLRQKGRSIEKVTPEVSQLIRDMLDTMYAAHGIGLAAQQVGKDLRLTVIDVSPIEDRPSWMEINGNRVEVNKQMPLTLINPELEMLGEYVTGAEGCLSFPEIYSDIPRPSEIRVKAMNADEQQMEFTAGGLLSRAIQHETDHLNGILFIDRMSMTDRKELKTAIEAVRMSTLQKLS